MVYSRKLVLDSNIIQKVIRNIGKIENFVGKWSSNVHERGEYLTECKYQTAIQNCASSLRISGTQAKPLSDNDIKVLIETLTVNPLDNEKEQYLAGQWKAIQYLQENTPDVLSEKTLCLLHNILFTHSKKDEPHRGIYKKVNNKIVATYQDGTQRTIFKTTPPAQVPQEMKTLIQWAQEEYARNDTHRLLIIAIFVYEFLAIHPFHDGNGRIARLLTGALLKDSGFSFVQYESLERIIEERRRESYLVLLRCQKKRDAQEESLGIWIEFFLDNLVEVIDRLENRLDRMSQNDVYLNKRQKDVLQMITHQGNVRVTDVVMHLETVSLPTVKRDLKYLFDNGIIDRIGKGKGTTYVSKN